jgi:hypothetical protein
MGPNVPAKSGNAVSANHSRLSGVLVICPCVIHMDRQSSPQSLLNLLKRVLLRLPRCPLLALKIAQAELPRVVKALRL